MMRFLLLIFALIFLAIPASAQIGIDGRSAPQDFSGASSFTWSHTVTASHDTILIVRCSTVDGAALAYISSITWNGSSLSRIFSNPNTATTFNVPAGNLQNRTDIWGKLSPATGTHNIVVTLNAAAQEDTICQSESLVNVNQSLTPDVAQGSAAVAGGGSGPPQPGGTVTTSATFDWVLDVGLNTSITTPTVHPPSSQDYSLNGEGPYSPYIQAFGSTQLANTISTYTMGWSGMTNAWSQSIIAIKWDGTVASPVTYYISPSGSDTNNGTSSGTPWLTRNHLTNCQDIMIAASGTYAEANFRVNTDGPVTCISGNNVRFLKCVVFDSCYISIASAGAFNTMTISSSYSGIQGWEVTANSAPSTNGCFEAYPPSSSVQIDHWIFANNIANGCGDGGVFTGWNGTTGVDYGAILGNIVYNSAQDNANCYSGIDAIPLKNSDTSTGTHMLIAGNYVWGAVDPNPCGGGLPTDGQGLSLDSLGETSYTGQVAIENNISVFNGGTCFQNFSSTTAPVYVTHNTCFGNETGQINANPCNEINVFSASLTNVYYNLAQASATNHCVTPGPVSRAEYALGSSFDATSDAFYYNFIYSSLGNNTTGVNSVFLNNVTGTSPAFVNPVEPSAPSCGSASSVLNCMATVISNFTPTAPTALPYGYQTLPSQYYDPLFPAWLCGVTNMPASIPMGCLTGSSKR